MMVLRGVTGRRGRRTWLLLLLLSLDLPFLTLLNEVESLAPPSPSSSSPGSILRIRRTVESDLSTVASFLSTASVQEGSFSWMERIWARHDIEGLLKRRLSAVTEGHKAKARLDHLNSNIYNNMDDKLYLEHLWWSSDRLRTEIAAAARETGEDSVWRRCGTQFPPDSIHWLNHIQMTACTADDRVVGFCEVAMLSNPTATATSTQDEKWLIACNDSKSNKDDNDDDSFRNQHLHNHRHNNRYYSPAITNLAVAPEYRRQGVGRRLLSRAETYVQRHWKAPTLGLYVQDTNAAANALYEQRGYIPEAAVYDERLGRLWYRSKALLCGQEKDQDHHLYQQQQQKVSQRSESFKEEDAWVALSSR